MSGADVPAEILDRASRVRLLLLDVDGVLTDGSVLMTPEGDAERCFDVRDGHGIRMGIEGGLLFGIISGRRSEVVARRAADLGIEEVHQRIHRKLEKLDEILKRRELAADEVCFIGDDLIDIPVMRRVGLAVAPADAVDEARAFAHHVTRRSGGRGAVREVVDLVLRATGQWDRVTERYLK